MKREKFLQGYSTEHYISTGEHKIHHGSDHYYCTLGDTVLYLLIGVVLGTRLTLFPFYTNQGLPSLLPWVSSCCLGGA